MAINNKKFALFYQDEIATVDNNTGVIRLQNNIKAKFVLYYLQSQIGFSQIKRFTVGSAIPALTKEIISQIKIPSNYTEIEDNIINIMDIAYNSKKQKEAEASELLASIDNYLLEQLGITLPPQTERKSSFITDFNKLSGGRFDPFYHQVEFEENKTVVKNGKYETKPLKQLVEKLVKGKLPKNEEKEGELKVVQINSIAPDGHIDITDLLTAKEIFTLEQQMQKNDVLIVITGATIGKIAIWELDENKDYYLGGDIVKFQCVKEINPHFIFAWLRCQNSQIEIKRSITGATNGHLSPSDIGKILIPLPPLEKQEAIAAHINEIRAKAKHLQHQAAETLEQAKQHVEKMILG